MHFIVLVNAPMNILNIVSVFMVLNNGGSLIHVIIVQVTAYTLIALIELFFMLRYIARPRELPSFRVIRGLFKSVSFIYAVDAIVAIRAMLAVYLISLVSTEAVVGLFSSAMQLYVPATLPISSLINSLLPMLVRQIEPGMQRFKASAETVIELISWISIPAATGLFIAAPSILVMFYGRESYAEATIFLRIVAFLLILDGITRLLGVLLYATSNEKHNLRIVLVFSVISLVGSVVAIGLYGAVGASVLTVFLTTGEFLVHAIVLARVLKVRFKYVPLMLRATVASAIMALALLFPLAGLPTLLQIIGAGIVYAVSLAVILLLTVGGPNKIKEHYLRRGRAEARVPAAVTLAPLAEPD
jgi:O-antigen/teichoic acid export membrane protein